MENRVITASRSKSLLLLVTSLAFVISSAFVVRSSREPAYLILWLTIAFFALCGLVALATLIRPHRLTLDSAGFTVSGGLMIRPYRIGWAAVDRFVVYSLPRGGKMVGWHLRHKADGGGLRALAEQLTGVDGALPKGWPGTPETLAAELNAYRTAAVGGTMLFEH
ncbi:hypothetical protein ACLB0R_13265 [Sphingomonas sp. GlSt437]